MQVGIYLAGAMRFVAEEENYDRGWRDTVIKEMAYYSSSVVIFNPMNTMIVREGEVRLFDKFSPEPNSSLKQDMASITRSDIVFMNLLSLDPTIMNPGYPHVGTLAELGISIAQNKLLIVLSRNPAVVKHPFVRGGATRVLPTLEEGIEYLQSLVDVLLGSEL